MAERADRNKLSPTLSRRDFVGAAGAGVAATMLGGADAAHAEAVRTRARPQDLRADVVIAGAGMGGLTAAVRAARAGARVVVLEKAARPGGTMRESAGGIWTYDDYEQMRHDVPEGDPELQRTVWETLPVAFGFYDEIKAPLGAPPAPGARIRSIAPVAFMNALLGDLEAHGGQVLTETPMIQLLVNPSHEVIGVLAHGPNGPVNVLGKAVILATGGWPGNAQLVQANITRNFGSLYQRNCGFNGLQPPLTGDGFVAARQIGAAESDGGFDSFYGHVLPARPAKFTHPLADYSIYHAHWAAALNLEGRRFADESRGRSPAVGNLFRSSEEIIAQEASRQPQATVIYVWDHEINQSQAVVGKQVLGNLDKYDAFQQTGAPTAMADTIDELAAKIEAWGRAIPADHVRATLNEYNQAARAGKAWALDVPKRDERYAKPLDQPPYYAVLGQTGITGPQGGLKVNTQGQVLDRGRRPISGLYAAGIDIGNIGNHVYVGFLCYGAVFGYITGDLAARQPEPRGGWEIGPVR